MIIANHCIAAGSNNIESGFSGTGNIDADPLFNDAGSNDYQLSYGSPCIDAGDNDTEQLPDHDFAGNPRQFDDPDSPDTGIGQVPIVDMGAYEYHESINPFDLDNDGDVDQDDLSFFAQDFGYETGLPGLPTDFDGDQDVDAMDLVIFSQAFGQ